MIVCTRIKISRVKCVNIKEIIEYSKNYVRKLLQNIRDDVWCCGVNCDYDEK